MNEMKFQVNRNGNYLSDVCSVVGSIIASNYILTDIISHSNIIVLKDTAALL